MFKNGYLKSILVVTALSIFSGIVLSIVSLAERQPEIIIQELPVKEYRDEVIIEQPIIEKVDFSCDQLIDCEIGQLGATIPVVTAFFETSLQSKITDTATSMTLNNGTDDSGDALSGYTCFVIDEGTTSEETVCGTAAGTAVTSMIRGIDPVDGDEEVTALKKSHGRGASVKITNHPQLAILSRVLNGDETLPNVLQYATSSTASMTNDAHVINKKYADDLAVAGSPDITESVKGIGELASIAELAAGTATGSTSANLLCHAEDFGNTSSAKQMVPVTDADGDIPVEFMELDNAWTFASTTNISNATSWQLGGTAFTGVMADLNEAEAFFDGTDISDTEAEDLTDGGTSSAHSHAKNVGAFTRQNSDGTGNQNIAHGLGSAPNLFVIYCTGYSSSDVQLLTSRGSATGTSDETAIATAIAGNTATGNSETVSGQVVSFELADSTDFGRAVYSAEDSTNVTLNWGTAVSSNLGIIDCVWEASF